MRACVCVRACVRVCVCVCVCVFYTIIMRGREDNIELERGIIFDAAFSRTGLYNFQFFAERDFNIFPGLFLAVQNIQPLSFNDVSCADNLGFITLPNSLQYIARATRFCK